jgi:hypothetical protein
MVSKYGERMMGKADLVNQMKLIVQSVGVSTKKTLTKKLKNTLY